MIIYLNASGVFHINGPVLDIFHFFFNTGIHMMSYRYMQCSERSKEKHFVNGISLFRLILVINVIIDDSASKKKLKNSIIMTDTHTHEIISMMLRDVLHDVSLTFILYFPGDGETCQKSFIVRLPHYYTRLFLSQKQIFI